MKDFIKDRNKAFGSGNIDEIKKYCKKYDIKIPKDEKTFLAGVHKAVCNLFILDISPVTIEQFNASYDWLMANGYSASLNLSDRLKQKTDGGETDSE